MSDKLKYFENKFCTILTQSTNRSFTDQQHANVFTGLVEKIDNTGIWLSIIPDMKRKAFFAMPIIGIIEEKYEKVTDEQLKEIKKTFQEKPTNSLGMDRLVKLKEKANGQANTP